MQGVTALPYRLPHLLNNAQPIFIVEGEKCADAVINLGLVATTNHGGAGKWWPPLVPFFKDRHVIIIPDNDEPGEKHARVVADALRGTARSIRILRLMGLHNKGDVADWISSGGTRADLIQLANAAPPHDFAELLPAEKDAVEVGEFSQQARIELVPWDGLTEVPVHWLIQDLLPARGFCALYGKPGSYKSFVALYIAAMVGAGLPAFGKDTQQGDVVYVAGEGGAGLKARRDAIVKTYDLDQTRVHFVRAQLDLRSTDAVRSALVSAIQAAGTKPSLIIVDTLARAFAGGGNENSSEDMGAFIRQIGALQQDLDAAVLVIHHSGKDEARGQRGHSSLLGAVDCELEVVKITDEANGDRAGQMTITKQKDGEDGFKINYRLAVAPLSAIDPTRTSLVVMPVEPDEIAPKAKRKPLSPQQKLIFDALQKALDQDGKLVNLPNVPRDKPCVKVESWRHAYYAMSPTEYDTKQKAFKRASEALLSNRTIGVWDDNAWITDG